MASKRKVWGFGVWGLGSGVAEMVLPPLGLGAGLELKLVRLGDYLSCSSAIGLCVLYD